jgi:transcriptional regulator with XRE-family HTH domain
MPLIKAKFRENRLHLPALSSPLPEISAMMFSVRYHTPPLWTQSSSGDARRTGSLTRSVAKGGNGHPGSRREMKLLDLSKTAGVGSNIRHLRTAKGLTLDRLANLSELTRGYISLVERGLKMPSIAALLRLAAALEVNVTYFFDPNSEQASRYTLFRREDRSVTKDAGFELIALAAGRTGKIMEPFLMSPPQKSAFRASHTGEEMLFVVNGQIAIKLDGEELTLSKGDCLYFSGETPHEVRSLGRQRAEILVVVALSPTAQAD